ncbi:hypothetical protein GCM10023096_07520 [Nonomuraea ferruginea]
MAGHGCRSGLSAPGLATGEAASREHKQEEYEDGTGAAGGDSAHHREICHVTHSSEPAYKPIARNYPRAGRPWERPFPVWTPASTETRRSPNNTLVHPYFTLHTDHGVPAEADLHVRAYAAAPEERGAAVVAALRVCAATRDCASGPRPGRAALPAQCGRAG